MHNCENVTQRFLFGIPPVLTAALMLIALHPFAAHALAPPANDDFVNAEVLVSGTWLGTNVDATTEVGEPQHAFVNSGASIWFQWTAPTDGYLTVDTFGSMFDTVLALYTGATVDALTVVAFDDDTAGVQSQLPDVPVTQGTVYKLTVAGYTANQGNITLTVSFFDGVDVTPPTIDVVRPVEGATYVENAVVTASYSCTDEVLGSGVATCTGDVEVGDPIDTSLPGAQQFSMTATDVAGNIDTTIVNYTIGGTDMTSPMVTISTPADGAFYAVGASITTSYICTDENFGSGMASCTGDVPSGTTLDTSVAGSFAFNVTATDNAGNIANAASNYTIVDTPSNDNFASAVVLADSGSWNGTNTGATVESGEPAHVALSSEASVWFQWTATIDGYFTVDTFGSDFNTALAMYTGSSIDALTWVAANNDSGGQQSKLTNIPVTAGTMYRIAVDGYFFSTGAITLNWSFIEQFDFDPPVITLWSPTNNSTIPQGDALWAGYSCYDPAPTSGLVSCLGPHPSGTLLDTSVPGNYTFTVTAVDGEGNVAEATTNYTIVGNPLNDDFADATVLANEGSISGSNDGATEELSEPFHAGSLGGTSVWFRWTAPADGFISANTVGSDFDTLLAIYSGSAVNALTEVDSNDNAVGAQSAIHNAPVLAGVTYSIAVSGAWDESGQYTLSWSFLALNDVTAPAVGINSPLDGGLYFEGTMVYASYSCTDEVLGSGLASCTGDVASGELIDTLAAGPHVFTVTGTDNSGNMFVATTSYTVLPFSNDNFINALPINGTGSLVASNVNASKEVGEPDHAGDVGGASVWFVWTAAEDGFLSVDTLFSDFDTTLAIYTGLTVDALTEIASDDNSLGQQSRIQDVPVTTGHTYYIAVDGVAAATGQIDLDWVAFTGPTFVEISPLADPLWVTDADHDFWLNAAAPADVDGDGDLDLAAIGYLVEYNVSVEYRLVVFMNDGPDVDGNWIFTTQEVPINGLFSNESDLSWGDFDGDGDPDLAVGAEGATELYRNDAGVLVPIETDLPGYFEDSNYSNAYDMRSLTWADFDNDADLDLLIPSTYDSATFTYGTALMRNDGSDGAGGWTFTEVISQIDGSIHAQTAWADNDGDGDLDLFMANVDNFLDNGFIRTYENNNGVFTSAEPLGNLIIEYGLGDWSDYDGDGDLDILIVGLIKDLDNQYKTLLRIYHNVAGIYQPTTIVQSSFYPWLDLHAATWADYDSDGDVDILLTGSVIGEDNIEGKSAIYVNEGGTFVPLGRELPAPVDSGNGGAFTWFDVDGDGDLDYFVSGAYYVPNGNNTIETQMHLYRNDSLVVNAAPQAPNGLSANQTNRTGSEAITLSWNTAIDDATPVDAITYDLEVRPLSGNPVTTHRRLPEPGSVSNATSWSVHGLAPGAYSWLVRSVDSAFNGSVAAQSTFTVGGPVDSDGDGILDNADNCTLLANADQRDTNGDGYGNMCDPDLDNNGVVNFGDVALWTPFFNTANTGDVDFDGDGFANFGDYALFPAFFLKAPGPSGIAP